MSKLGKNHYDYYLKLVFIMPPEIAFYHTDLPLFYETDLKHISEQINKMKEQKENHLKKKMNLDG